MGEDRPENNKRTSERVTSDESSDNGHADTDIRRADVGSPIAFRVFGQTDVGLVRENNQDNFLVSDLRGHMSCGNMDGLLSSTVEKKGIVLSVCDGMGGAAAGEVASLRAVETIYKVFEQSEIPSDRDDFARTLVTSVEEAGAQIFRESQADRTMNGMGTTATVAGLIDHILFVGQVGDSRAYLLRDETLTLITKDQSLVNQLIEAGQLTEEEAESFEHSNIILQALGTQECAEVDLTFLELRDGDRLMLCSDGLSGVVHAEMIREVMLETEDVIEVCGRLIEMANAGGGHDNITCIVADFSGGLKAPDSVTASYQQYPLPRENSPSAERPLSDHAVQLPPSMPNWLVPLLLTLGLALVIALVYLSTTKIEQGGVRVQPIKNNAQAPIEYVSVGIRAQRAYELWIDGERKGPPSDSWAFALAKGNHQLEWHDHDGLVGKHDLEIGENPIEIELEKVGSVQGADVPDAAEDSTEQNDVDDSAKKHADQDVDRPLNTKDTDTKNGSSSDREAKDKAPVTGDVAQKSDAADAQKKSVEKTVAKTIPSTGTTSPDGANDQN